MCPFAAWASSSRWRHSARRPEARGAGRCDRSRYANAPHETLIVRLERYVSCASDLLQMRVNRSAGVSRGATEDGSNSNSPVVIARHRGRFEFELNRRNRAQARHPWTVRIRTQPSCPRAAPPRTVRIRTQPSCPRAAPPMDGSNSNSPVGFACSATQGRSKFELKRRRGSTL